MIRKHLLIEGKVQGVFFRAHIQQVARSLGFRGWAKNRSDGRVEAVLEGEAKNWPEMFAWCGQGPPAAAVRQIEVTDEPYRGEYRDFAIRY